MVKRNDCRSHRLLFLTLKFNKMNEAYKEDLIEEFIEVEQHVLYLQNLGFRKYESIGVALHKYAEVFTNRRQDYDIYKQYLETEL